MNKTITLTGSDEAIYLEREFNGQDVIIKSKSGATHYIPVKAEADLSGWAVRTAESTIVSSAASGDDGIGAGSYTVPDGTVFREGEVVLVTDTSDNVKGGIKINSISGNVLSFLKKSVGSSFEPVLGDKLILREDGYLDEDDADLFKSTDYKYLLVNGSGSLVCEVQGTGLKKKY